MTEVQKQEANAHPLEGSPGSPTSSCQDKLKQTRRYQAIRHQQNTQTRIKKPTRRVQKTVRNSTQHEDSMSKVRCIVKDEDNFEEFVSKKGPSSQHLSGFNQDEVDQRISEDHKQGPVKPDKTPVKEVYQPQEGAAARRSQQDNGGKKKEQE
ncbi:unnamed protein product [Caenorhabditis brenneri]